MYGIILNIYENNRLNLVYLSRNMVIVTVVFWEYHHVCSLNHV
jgi:hypothetical protein